jgi:hypothetical protein
MSAYHPQRTLVEASISPLECASLTRHDVSCPKAEMRREFITLLSVAAAAFGRKDGSAWLLQAVPLR